MRSIDINTRTMPPTERTEKRVRVRTSEGALAEYSWDHSYDAPEVHERAARRILGEPDEAVTIQRTGSHEMGYTFRALIGDADA